MADAIQGLSRRELFDAMIREDDDNKRGELTRLYHASLCADVEAARRERQSAPRMALRRYQDETLDDVVVEHPTMFRAEFMDSNHLWMCCYFPEPHDRIAFGVHWDKKEKSLKLYDTELPAEWVDIDKARRPVPASTSRGSS